MTDAYTIIDHSYDVVVVGAGGVSLTGAAQAKGVEHDISAWVRISADNSITIITPAAEMGQGSMTGVPVALAEELDADWSKLSVVSAPAESAFANVVLGKGFLSEMSGYPGIIGAMPMSLLGTIARQLNLQITGGSSALPFTGPHRPRSLCPGPPPPGPEPLPSWLRGSE